MQERFKEQLGQIGIGSPYTSKRKNDLWDKENDLIIDYRGLGVFGASLYFQAKEAKLRKAQDPKYLNRGAYEKTTEEYVFNVLGNYSSAFKYIIDQTFARGILSVAKAVTDEDTQKMSAFLADITVTMSSGLLPNSLTFIDKMNRDYAVDYDSKDSEAFKAFGIKVEDANATLFFTKLATKFSERWPFGDPAKYVDLPFVESDRDKLPIKIDAFGKEVLQTPEGAVFGNWMYNTFDVFKVTNAVAGYEIPDWEALVYLAVKKGDNWEAIPQLLPRRIMTPSGPYKFAPEEYNNMLKYNSQIRRELIQENIIDNGQYKEYIDVNSSINKDPNGKPITGKNNQKILYGYELLGDLLQEMYANANKMTMLANWTFIDKEREKKFNEDPNRYFDELADEKTSVIKDFFTETYGGQDQGADNRSFVQMNKGMEPFLEIDKTKISDPKRFKKYALGAMEQFKQFNGDPNTAIITNNNTSADPNKTESTYQVGGNVDVDEAVPTKAQKPAPTLKPMSVDEVDRRKKDYEKQTGKPYKPNVKQESTPAKQQTAPTNLNKYNTGGNVDVD